MTMWVWVAIGVIGFWVTATLGYFIGQWAAKTGYDNGYKDGHFDATQEAKETDKINDAIFGVRPELDIPLIIARKDRARRLKNHWAGYKTEGQLLELGKRECPGTANGAHEWIAAYPNTKLTCLCCGARRGA